MAKGSDILEETGRVIGEVRKLLEFLQMLGVEEEPVWEDLAEEKDRNTQRPTNTPGRREELARIARSIARCRKCSLCESRQRTVPGEGSDTPEIVFIGEGPGAEEDLQGRPFVGAAGQLLTRMIEAMGYARDEVWIGNIVKCRPPGNRAPYPDEMEACLPYLRRQLAILQPKVIVCLGATAVKGLLGSLRGITELRGKWQEFEGIAVMPTFHPAYLLRNPEQKKPVWQDLKEVLRYLGRKPPARR